MTRKYSIDLTNIGIEGSAAVLAIFAYPEANSDGDVKLASLQATLTHMHYKARAEMDPDWANIPLLIKPLYAFRDQKLIDQDLRQIKRRFRDRAIAAKIAMPFLQEVELGHPPELPTGIKQLSLAAMCQFVQDEAEQGEAKNVENRIWRISLPVIHLATATAVIIDQLEKTGVTQPSFAHFLNDPSKMKALITTANQHAELFYQSRLNIQPETLIQVTTI